MLRAKYSFTDNRLNGNSLYGIGLNGRLSSKGATTMRVFCPEHKRSFFAPRQSPVKCENRGHVLGELDFAGERKSSSPFQWQYCCNCEHFSLIEFKDNGLQRCPVCSRRTTTLYLCERCYVISFESNTPLETKNFTLTSEGAPRPCCPGCLQPASADLREHTCDEAQAAFVTGLNTCPFCSERLDIGPLFPSTVANYVRRTRAANKLYVTFDYETELFVPIEDGEFVLIRNNDDTGNTFVLPRSSRLTAPKDFYELYQDYYHCAAPEAGEITISEPATVAETPSGWRFHAPGVFLAFKDQPKKETAVPARETRAHPISESASGSGSSSSARETRAHPISESASGSGSSSSVRETRALPISESASGSGLSSSVRETRALPVSEPAAGSASPSSARETRAVPILESDDSVAACTKCNTLIEAKYSFCWKCGHPRAPRDQSAGFRPQRSRLIVSAMEEDEEELNRPDQKRSMLSSTFSWASAVTREPKTGSSRSVLKLFSLLVVGFLIGAVIAITRLSSSSAAPEQAVAPAAPANAAPVVQTEVTPPVEMKAASMEIPATNEEDTVLERLRQMRAASSASEQSKILKNLSETERKFSADYRFPYERAKVVVMTRKRNFREEAFTALARAAQKAIHSGKAREMLQNLNKDSEGDFQKLSHGHREWAQLQKALKSKDVSVLDVEEGL